MGVSLWTVDIEVATC